MTRREKFVENIHLVGGGEAAGMRTLHGCSRRHRAKEIYYGDRILRAFAAGERHRMTVRQGNWITREVYAGTVFTFEM